MTSVRRQRGITLLISLIMLTVLTLFASAMIRLSSTNVLIAGNMAVQHSLRDAVQQAIESDLNSTTFYTDAVLGHETAGGWWDGTTTHTGTYNGYTVTLNKPVCLKYQPAAGNSALTGSNNNIGGSEDTYWEVTATGTDVLTGTSVSLTQGVKITTPAGNCNP